MAPTATDVALWMLLGYAIHGLILQLKPDFPTLPLFWLMFFTTMFGKHVLGL